MEENESEIVKVTRLFKTNKNNYGFTIETKLNKENTIYPIVQKVGCSILKIRRPTHICKAAARP